MPAQQGGHEVGGAEEVEPARERAAGDAVQRRGVPGHLGLVDGEVRGDGAVQALGGEDGVGVRGLGGLGFRVRFCGRGLEGDVSAGEGRRGVSWGGWIDAGVWPREEELGRKGRKKASIERLEGRRSLRRRTYRA